MPDSDIGRKPFLKFRNLRAHHVLAVLQHPVNARPNIGFERTVLGLEINEWDHDSSLVHSPATSR